MKSHWTNALFLGAMTMLLADPCFAGGPAATVSLSSEYSKKKDSGLLIHGRVVYDKERIEGVKVYLYKGNELIMETVTEKNGRYEAELEFGYEYMFRFQKEGYLNKMFAVDAKNDLPKYEIENPTFPVNVIMIPLSKFDGVDMDVLEFPFAYISYSKRMRMFDYDTKYTQNMSRALAAAMLQSGRKKD